MNRTMERWSILLLLVLTVMSLACAGSQSNDSKTMCERPRSTWKGLSKSTQSNMEKACDIKGDSCTKKDDLACRSLWTYGAQYYTLENWQLQHRKATTIDKLDAYITYFLKPTFRMHEEYWANGLKEKNHRAAMAKATDLMRKESKTLTDDYIVKVRNEIRAKTNPKERALLIEAYSIMKRLNLKAFEPFDEYDAYRKDVRAKLERYEKVKIQLEFVDRPDTKPPTKPEEKPSTQPETKPAETPTTKPAPETKPPAQPDTTTPKTTPPTTPETKPEAKTEAKKTPAKKSTESKEAKDTAKDITEVETPKGDEKWKLD